MNLSRLGRSFLASSCVLFQICNLVRCSELCDLRYSGSCPASNACLVANALGSSGNLGTRDWSDIGEGSLVEETDLMFRSSRSCDVSDHLPLLSVQPP